MVVFKKAEDLRRYLLKINEKGGVVGFVPTMGALHDGHMSLIAEAKKVADIVVCSIFVNPTQFDDKTDFEKYPVTIPEDLELLTDGGCDIVFTPSVNEMYPNGTEGQKVYDFGYLETVLEGAHRKGHFAGVGQVVGRLLEIVEPDKLLLGQKDYQQCMVIKSLIEQMGVENLELVICSTKREADGLAMSSRNRRLTNGERQLAPLLYQCLVSIKTKNGMQSFDVVKKECLDILSKKGIEPEYVALADADDLTVLEDYDEHRNMVTLIASKVGDVRLIDNMLLN